MDSLFRRIGSTGSQGCKVTHNCERLCQEALETFLATLHRYTPADLFSARIRRRDDDEICTNQPWEQLESDQPSYPPNGARGPQFKSAIAHHRICAIHGGDPTSNWFQEHITLNSDAIVLEAAKGLKAM